MASREPPLYRHRTIVAALAIIVAILCVHFRAWTPALAGRTMFIIFAWGGFFLCLLEAARSAADAISGEKREGTLGLLFLTDLRTHDVVLGKLAFVGVRSGMLLLPILPVFAVPLLLGGVTGSESWRVMLALFVTLLFGLSTALFASAISVNSTAALGKAALLLMLMFVQPALLIVSGSPFWPVPAHWTSGPLGMLAASTDASFTANPASFWFAALLSLSLSVILLTAAGHFMRRQLSTIPILAKPPWWQRWVQPRRGYVAPWGEASTQSPAVWLAARTLPGQRFLWIFICIGLVACLVSGLFGVMMVAVGLQLFFGVLLKFWITIVAPQSLHELRKSGALELILCTPLQPDSIVRGQVDVFYESFVGPAFMIAVGFPIALYGGAVLAHPTQLDEAGMMIPLGIMWVIYTFLDLHALGYLGMWHGLSSQRIESAIGKTAWYGLVLPWLFIVIPILGWVALLFWPVIIIHWATSRLNNRFHEPLLAAS